MRNNPAEIKKQKLFRYELITFLTHELAPHYNEWERAGIVPKEIWKKIGRHGYLCTWAEKKYGGRELGFEYAVITIEEMMRAGLCGLFCELHGDICAPYIDSFGTEEQKKRWLPGAISGEIILSLGMTEPNAGSDLASIQTTAVKNGNHFVINGEKTFISNGIKCDLAIIACKTETGAKTPYGNVSLICVEDGTQGFSKGRNLKKMGLHSQDTAELIFIDCRVPVSNLLGEEGQGFYYLMQKLQQERLIASIAFQVQAEATFDQTMNYLQKKGGTKKSIGYSIHDTTQIVEMATEIKISRTFVENLIRNHIEKRDIVKGVSMAKWWTSDLSNRVASQCMQIYQDYGYLEEYKIGRWFRDVRVNTIYGGTNEIMKRIIAKSLGI
jgi:acyl-CoA dehydrogenase